MSDWRSYNKSTYCYLFRAAICHKPSALARNHTGGWTSESAIGDWRLAGALVRQPVVLLKIILSRFAEKLTAQMKHYVNN